MLYSVRPYLGVWRSWLARTLDMGEVTGSSPVTPTDVASDFGFSTESEAAISGEFREVSPSGGTSFRLLYALVWPPFGAASLAGGTRSSPHAGRTLGRGGLEVGVSPLPAMRQCGRGGIAQPSVCQAVRAEFPGELRRWPARYSRDGHSKPPRPPQVPRASHPCTGRPPRGTPA